jgi:hypothetical protein
MAHHAAPTAASTRLGASIAERSATDRSATIECPHDAADEIVPMFRTMRRGIVLLLLDAGRRPVVGLAVHGAPRNEFEPIVELLASLGDGKPDAVILGVLSHEASLEDEPFVFGDDALDTSERLAVDAATVHAWAEFSCRLEAEGITLLDVIECTPWSWASAHAPSAPYLATGRGLGHRPGPTRGDRRQRVRPTR